MFPPKQQNMWARWTTVKKKLGFWTQGEPISQRKQGKKKRSQSAWISQAHTWNSQIVRRPLCTDFPKEEKCGVGLKVHMFPRQTKNRDWKCTIFLRKTKRDIRRANSGDKLVFGVRSKWSPALMYSRSPCGSPCQIGSRHKDNIVSSTCNETKWHHQCERLIAHLDTLLTRPSGSHWSTHLGLKAHKFLENNQGLCLYMHNVPRKRLDLRVLNMHKLPQDKSWDSRYTSFSRETGFGTPDALISRTCLWDYAGFAIGRFQKTFQDNAMEPQGSALWHVAAADTST